ncbi:hypothetical protein SLA2020_059170 [Shorea laevis]
MNGSKVSHNQSEVAKPINEYWNENEHRKRKARHLLRQQQKIFLKRRPELKIQLLLSRSCSESLLVTFPANSQKNKKKRANRREKIPSSPPRQFLH